jgi:hypothetical protein
MIGFDRVIGVLLHDVASAGQQLIEHTRVGRCPIDKHLAGPWAVTEGPGEEPAGGRQIPFLGDQHVDDLPVLVDRPGQIHPPPSDLHIRLIHTPAITRCVPTGPCRVDQQWGEPLHPSVDRDVINDDASFGQKLFHVAVRTTRSAGTTAPRP